MTQDDVNKSQQISGWQALRAERDSWRAKAEKAEANNREAMAEACDLAAKLARAREMLTNVTGASGEDEAKQFAEWGLLDSATPSVPMEPKEEFKEWGPVDPNCPRCHGRGRDEDPKCGCVADPESWAKTKAQKPMCGHDNGSALCAMGAGHDGDHKGLRPDGRTERWVQPAHWSTKVFGAIPESAEAPGPEEECDLGRPAGRHCVEHVDYDNDCTACAFECGWFEAEDDWGEERDSLRAELLRTTEALDRAAEEHSKAEAERDQARDLLRRVALREWENNPEMICPWCAVESWQHSGPAGKFTIVHAYRCLVADARAYLDLASVEKGETP